MTRPRVCVPVEAGVYQDLCMHRVSTNVLSIGCLAYSVSTVCGRVLDAEAIGHQD